MSREASFVSKVRGLAEETLRVAVETGPRAGIRRTLAGQRAVIETLLELRDELPAPPPAETVMKAVSAGQKASAVGDGSGAAGAFLEPLVEWSKANVPPELAPKLARNRAPTSGALR